MHEIDAIHYRLHRPRSCRLQRIVLVATFWSLSADKCIMHHHIGIILIVGGEGGETTVRYHLLHYGLQHLHSCPSFKPCSPMPISSDQRWAAEDAAYWCCWIASPALRLSLILSARFEERKSSNAIPKRLPLHLY